MDDMQQKFEAWRKSTECAEAMRFGNLETFGMAAYAEGMREGQPKWIPVEERLPSENNEYLVSEPEVGTTSADFRDGEWFSVRSFGVDCEERPLYAVTHWQPLPALPLSTEAEKGKA